MTMHTAHPIQQTAMTYRFDAKYQRRQIVPVMRRIAGVSLSSCHIDLLQNTARVQRPSWDASLSLGGYTLAIVRKG